MANVTLLHYNNYFNRIVKKEASYAAYLTADPNYNKTTNVNFVPGDGVTTSLVLGTSSLVMGFDYLIVTEMENSAEVIKSRWFITEENRTRDGQYEVFLKRDVIVDNYTNVVSAPTFIEKGMINDITNPLLFNNESMTYNQIKQDEQLLKDETGCGWVVGYIPQDAFKTTTNITKSVVLSSDADISVNGLSNWTYYPYCSLNNARTGAASSSSSKTIALKSRVRYTSGQNVSINADYYWVPPSDQKYNKALFQYTQNSYSATPVVTSIAIDNFADSLIGAYWPVYPGDLTAIGNVIRGYIQSDTTLWSNADSYVAETLPNGVSIVSQSTINNIIALDGKTIKDTSSDSVYRINVTNTGISGDNPLDTSITYGATILTRINSILSSHGLRDTYVSGAHPDAVWATDYSANDISVSFSGSVYSIVLTQIMTYASVSIDNNRNHVTDAPYDMFCIPYSDTKSICYADGGTVLCNKELAVGIAQEIAADAGSGAIYDTQLLPYCPCKELIIKNQIGASADNATLDLRGLSIDLIKDTTDSFTEVTITNQADFTNYENLYGQLYDEDYREIYYYSASNAHYYYRNVSSATKIIGALIWCTSATRSFEINFPITVSNNALERKVENETDMYRLCSGNYQGVFEFSAAKSNGVTGFKVDCTFKPFNPYIHVIPKLSGLYGDFASYNDARGLICGGDFSLAQLSNAWANYELQNKNYQQIFDRSIQNMDVNNSIAQTEAKWQIATGTVTGASGGATAGGMLGGGWGAAAGAVIGGGMSLAGGIADYQNLLRRQEEARSYAIDMFGYNLGNIKAIPTSLSKNTSLNPNIKIFPFIEKYSCTDEEKQALRDKITYNGMTVMKVDLPSNYIVSGTPQFLKGQIIRLSSLNDDSHVANAIYDELNKGVYI